MSMREKLVAIPTGTKLLFVKKEEILYCCGEGSYTHLYLKNGKKITISKNLKEVETTLNSETFVRIHNSHLINILHATAYINNGYNCVVLSNGEELSVSRNRKKELMAHFIRL